MPRRLFAFAAVILASSSGFGQQTGLTEAQTATARMEVPELVRLLDLKPGAIVADVGAGFGAWTLEFARWTGSAGRVYATDLGNAQLTALREMVQRERLDNVTVLAAAVDSTNLPAGCCDAILVRDAYHHFTRPADVVRSLAASLKPGGRLAIVDFPPRPNTTVPDGVPADRGGHGVPQAVVEREVGAALTHVRTTTNWSPKSQPADLFLVLFRKP
jgi:cyclopropane fatty-acyl-phospholipid synthase-like methyltransferase